MTDPVRSIADALWCIGQGYTVDDLITADWSPLNQDDVADEALHMGYARQLLPILVASGWTPPGGREPQHSDRQWRCIGVTDTDPDVVRQARELAEILPESARLEYFAPHPGGVYGSTWTGPVGWFLDGQRISHALYDELVKIRQARQQVECAADGHPLPIRRCRCGERVELANSLPVEHK